MSSSPPVNFTPLKRFFRLMRHYKTEIRYILLYALGAGLINLSLPLGVQAIIGLLAGGSISASWGVLVFLVILGAVFTGVLRILQLSLTEHLQQRILSESAIDFAIRLPRIRLEKIRESYLPEVVNRFFDATSLQKGLPKLLIDGSTALISIILSLTVLSFYHPSFVSFSLLLLILLSVMLWFTGPSGLQTSLLESKYKYKIAFWLEEIGRLSEPFKMGGKNKFPLQKTDSLTMGYLDARRKHWRILLIHFIGGLAFRVFVVAGFLILGSLLVMNNELNLGQFVASEILVLFVADSVEKLILLHETGYDILTATEKLGQVTDLPLEREGGSELSEICPDEALRIELKDVNYDFEPGSKSALQNINLKIEPGERVAITGYSSAGVSTLMKIIALLRLDYTGNYLINDFPAANIDLRNMREHIGNVNAHTDIFSGSILENITLGRDGINMTQIWEKANLTGLSEFIRELPDGLDTLLMPGGRNIPGNVVTKILLTRAIIFEPLLLTLEKPLHALSFKGRMQISALLTDRSRRWTLVCATEDPLMASMCDRVVVLDGGKIVFDDHYSALLNTPHFDHIFKTGNQENNP